MKALIYLLILIPIFCGCETTRQLGTNEVRLKVKPNGKTGFLGVMINKKPVVWAESSGMYTRKYKAELKNPEFILSKTGSIFNGDIGTKIENTFLSQYAMEDFTDLMTKKKQKAPYYCLDTQVPYFDAGNTMLLDFDCLELANSYINKDYYLLMYAYFKVVETPMLYTSFRFHVTPAIMFVLYSRDGKKVFAKQYSKEYKNAKGTDMTAMKNWYLQFEMLLKDSDAEIQKDLSFLNQMQDAPEGKSLKSYFESLSNK